MLFNVSDASHVNAMEAIFLTRSRSSTQLIEFHKIKSFGPNLHKSMVRYNCPKRR